MNPYLDNVVDFGLDEVKQGGDAPLGRLLDLDGAAADRSNRLPDEVNVHLGGVPEVEKEPLFQQAKTLSVLK